jgi:hypothetical protein
VSWAGGMGLAGMAAAGYFCWRLLASRWGRLEAAAGAYGLVAALAWIAALSLPPQRLACFWIAAGAAAGLARALVPLTPLAPLSWPPKAALLLLAFPAFTLAAALFGAPNTYDGMAYHLPRIMNWLQAGGLRPFASHDPRQLYFAPLAEVMGLHLYVMAGCDRLLALTQWSAYLLCGALAWGAARRLGGNRAALFALLACWSAPMALAQASSTQNDLFCAALCLGAASLLWRAAREAEISAAAMGGLLAGLACLTKPTAYLFLAPWILALPFLGGFRPARLVAQACAALLVFAALQAPFWLGNRAQGQPPLGPDTGTSMSAHSPALIAASALKQAALHLPGFSRDRAGAAIDKGLRALGQDPVDPRNTSYWSQPFFGLPPAGPNDSTAADWAQLLVFLALGLGFFALGRPARLAWLLAAAGFLLFCAMVKWQPWSSRLHTPAFAFASLAIGLGLAAWPRRLALAAAALMAAGGLPALLHLEERPVFSSHSVLSVPRWEQFFRGREALKARVEAALDGATSNDCGDIALAGGGDNPEYLLWEGMRLRRGGRPFTIRSRGVGNASAAFELKDPAPCLSLDGRWGRP